MHEDEEGFLYPLIDMSFCIECGLCENVCPVINQSEVCSPLKVYAAKNPNEQIRLSSSSGGIFTMLAEQILKENGIVFGARFDEKWEVEHDYADTLDGIAAFRGSKYVQSRIGDSYQRVEDFLRKGRKVLFSGTPCQVAGLKRFLHNKEYDNLLTVDVICHGVPSPLIWRKYLEETIRPKGVAGKKSVLKSGYPPLRRTKIRFWNPVYTKKEFTSMSLLIRICLCKVFCTTYIYVLVATLVRLKD
ncbi:Coenzyme F420 hydrogenase/dehydrogenase, beta subunit C-terminal domain [Bacteroides thetaiotaomicron]|uniref:Coenzyme F420 hydrogenase/dehydrogenase, beta subunit C-terminal domain n=1 Tax=Bacteroides thetaiotaomicron TaxID=818 RepID=UPI0021654E05|nr:Coenzyme F420 hydrogenase/dehydrogenase, beta subunit C-terminal domain [Bacteroides thetaiotaomicron]MCS2450406.1 Coenzyme F420 hydrogenase/dehydrogenase, beta subunit C-terminal domain [Bacteroides thetaiotaomicron]